MPRQSNAGLVKIVWLLRRLKEDGSDYLYYVGGGAGAMGLWSSKRVEARRYFSLPKARQVRDMHDAVGCTGVEIERGCTGLLPDVLGVEP